MDEKQLQALYNAVSAKFNVGDFTAFKAKMATTEDRKRFYTVVGDKGFDLGDYNAYETKLAGVKKKDASSGTSSQPAGTPSVAPAPTPAPVAKPSYNGVQEAIAGASPLPSALNPAAPQKQAPTQKDIEIVKGLGSVTKEQRTAETMAGAKKVLPAQKPLTQVQPRKKLTEDEVTQRASEQIKDPLYATWIHNTDDPIGAVQQDVRRRTDEIPVDINNYDQSLHDREEQARINQRTADIITNGYFADGSDAEGYLKKQGINTDVTPEQLAHIQPRNETERVALEKFKGKRTMDELLKKYSFEEAAMRFHDPSLNGKTYEQFRREDNATAGQYYAQFIQNPDIQERARHDTKTYMQLQNAKNTLATQFPEAAEAQIAALISEKLDQSGKTNYIANNPTKEQTDWAVAELEKEDKMPWSWKVLYEKRLVPKIERATSLTNTIARGIPIANAFADENPIKSKGVFENALASYRNTIKGGAKTVEEATTTPLATMVNPRGDADIRAFDRNEAARQTQFEPEGGGKISATLGNIAGMLYPTIAGAGGLKAMGASENMANALAFAFSTAGEHQTEARERFKGSPGKQAVYTALTSTLDAILGGALSKGLTKGVASTVKNDIAVAIEDYTAGKLSSAAARDLVKNSIAQNVLNVAKEIATHNTKGASMMAAPMALDYALNEAFGEGNHSFHDTSKAIAKEFQAAWWATTFLSALPAVSKVRGDMTWGKALLQQVQDPDYRGRMEQSGASLEALKNYDTAVKIFKELKETDVSPKDLPSLLLHEVTQTALEEKLKNTQSPSIKEKIKGQIAQSKEQAQKILDRQDVDLRTQDVLGNKGAAVVAPSENKPAPQVVTIAPKEELKPQPSTEKKGPAVILPNVNAKPNVVEAKKTELIEPTSNYTAPTAIKEESIAEQPSTVVAAGEKIKEENKPLTHDEKKAEIEKNRKQELQTVTFGADHVTKPGNTIYPLGDPKSPKVITKVEDGRVYYANEDGSGKGSRKLDDEFIRQQTRFTNIISGNIKKQQEINAKYDAQLNELSKPAAPATNTKPVVVEPTKGSAEKEEVKTQINAIEQQSITTKTAADHQGDMAGGKPSAPKSEAKNPAGLPAEKVSEGFTESKNLNKLFADTKAKYGDKKGSTLYETSVRLVNPNKNTIVEIRSNGVVVKEGDRHILKPFGNTDANHKKWTLYKGIDVSEHYEKPEPMPAQKTRQDHINDLVDRAAAYRGMDRKDKGAIAREANEIKLRAKELGLSFDKKHGRLYSPNSRFAVNKRNADAATNVHKDFDPSVYHPDTRSHVQTVAQAPEALHGMTIVDNNGQRLTQAAVDKALKGIQDGRPTHGTKAIYDFVQKAVEDGHVELEDKTTGRRAKVPVKEYFDTFKGIREQASEKRNEADFDALNTLLGEDADRHAEFETIFEDLQNNNNEGSNTATAAQTEVPKPDTQAEGATGSKDESSTSKGKAAEKVRGEVDETADAPIDLHTHEGLPIFRGAFDPAQKQGFYALDRGSAEGYAGKDGHVVEGTIKKDANVLRLLDGDTENYEPNEAAVKKFGKIIKNKEATEDMTEVLWGEPDNVERLRKAGVDIVIGNTMDGPAVFVVNHEAVDYKGAPKPKAEPGGRFEAKAKKLAEKINNTDLPKWLKGIDDPTIQKQGLGAEDLKRVLAEAVVNVGKLMDSGVELAEAIRRGADHIIDHYKTELAKYGGKLKPEMERQIRDGFEQHYKERFSQYAEDDLHGIRHADNDKRRERLGMEEYDPGQESIEQWDAEGAVLLQEKYNGDPEMLLNELEAKNREPNKLENRILIKYGASLDEAMQKNPTAEVRRKAQRASEIFSTSGTETARDLASRRGGGRSENTLTNAILDEAESLKVRAEDLTEERVQQVKAEYEELQKRKAQFEEDVARHKAEQELLEQQKAEFERKKQEAAKQKAAAKQKPSSGAPKPKKTHEDFVTERKKIVANIRADLLKAAKGAGGLQSSLPGYAQFKAVAPHVPKLVRSYLEEGVTKLDDVVSRAYDDLKDVVPGISKRDVRDLIAGEYNEKKLTRNEIAAAARDMQTEADLLNKLELALKGEEPKTEKQKNERNSRIKELRDKLEAVRKRNRAAEREGRKLSAADLAKREEKRLVRELDKAEQDLQDLRDGKVKDPKGEAPLTERAKAIKQRLQDVRNDIKDFKAAQAPKAEDPNAPKPTEAELYARQRQSLLRRRAALEADVKAGRYEKESKPKPRIKLNAEEQANLDAIIKIEQQQKLRRARAEFQRKSGFSKTIHYIWETLGARRLINAAVDASIIFRQAVHVTMNPFKLPTTIRAINQARKVAFSPAEFQRFQHGIESSDLGRLFKEVGGVLTNPIEHGLEPHEEQFMQNIFHSIGHEMEKTGNPALKAVVKGVDKAWFSERVASAVLNTIRMEEFARKVDALERQGVTMDNAPEKYKAAAGYVMNITGRGKLLKMLEDSHAGRMAANNTFFGARLMASRINLLNPAYYHSLPKELRMEVIKDMAGYSAGLILAAMAAKAAGATVSTDYDDSDFLQVRFGDKVYDLSGGSAAYVRTFLRLTDTALRIGKNPSHISKADKSYAEFGGKSVFNTMFVNKLAPNNSYLYHAITGHSGERDEQGHFKPFDPYEVLQYYPMYVDDVVKGYKEDGFGATFSVLAPNILGIGYQNYPDKAQKGFGGGGAGMKLNLGDGSSKMKLNGK